MGYLSSPVDTYSTKHGNSRVTHNSSGGPTPGSTNTPGSTSSGSEFEQTYRGLRILTINSEWLWPQ